MAKSTRTAKDINVTAFSIMQKVTGQKTSQPEQFQAALNNDELRKQLMREMGRRGGQKGGRKRADGMSKQRRKEIAELAAKARWSKKK